MYIEKDLIKNRYEAKGKLTVFFIFILKAIPKLIIIIIIIRSRKMHQLISAGSVMLWQ